MANRRNRKKKNTGRSLRKRAPRAIKSRKRRGEKLGRIIGSSVVDQSHAFSNNPDDFLAGLSYQKRIECYREMCCDAIISGSLMQMIGYILSFVDRIKPASDHPKAIEAAQLLRECLDDMDHSWAVVKDRSSAAYINEVSALEIIYKKRLGPNQRDPKYRSKFSDGAIGWRCMANRPMSSLEEWDIDEGTGQIIGMVQRSDKGASNYIAHDKLFVFKLPSLDGDDNGRSLLRGAANLYIQKRRVRSQIFISLDREQVGIPIIHLPLEVMDSDKPEDVQTVEEYADLGERLGNGKQAWIMIPHPKRGGGEESGYGIGLMKSAGTSTNDPQRLLEAINFQMAVSLLSQSILLGSKAGGSYGLAKNQTSMMQNAVDSFTKLWASEFNRQCVVPLMQKNEYDPEHFPELLLIAPYLLDVNTMINNIIKLKKAGILKNSPSLMKLATDAIGAPVTDELSLISEENTELSLLHDKGLISDAEFMVFLRHYEDVPTAVREGFSDKRERYQGDETRKLILDIIRRAPTLAERLLPVIGIDVAAAQSSGETGVLQSDQAG